MTYVETELIFLAFVYCLPAICAAVSAYLDTRHTCDEDDAS